MTEWVSFENNEDEVGYDHVPAMLPTEVLGRWTERYRKLEILSWPEGADWIKGVDFDPDTDPRPNDWRDAATNWWQAQDDLRKARLKLRDFYHECGWDAESKTQESFDRERFVRLRYNYFEEVLKPLEDRCYGAVNNFG